MGKEAKLQPVPGYNAMRYGGAMIRDFADREAERIRSGLRSRELPADIQPIALRKLRLLNQAREFSDLRVPPGNRLEPWRAIVPANFTSDQ